MLSLFSDESPHDLPIGVVAEGGGALQGKLLRAIEVTKTSKITMRCKDVDECASAMRSGIILAFVQIPADLEKKALRLETPAVTVYTNGQSLLTSKLITNELRVAIATQGALLVKNVIGPPISAELHIVGNPAGNFEYFLGIGLVIALFHVIAMLLGAYLFTYPIREKQACAWFASSGNSVVVAFLGRYLPAVFVLGTELSIMLAVARRGMPSLQFVDLVVLFGGAYLMVAICLSLGATFAGVTGEMRIALSSAAVVGGPAFAFCGQTFPIFAMPVPIRFWTFLLPITHMMQLQSAFFFGHDGISRAFHSFEILCAFFVFWTLVALLLTNFRLCRTVKKEEAESCCG